MINVKPTADQVKAFVRASAAIAEAIRELGEVPAGELYANVMSHLSLDAFEAVLKGLIRCRLVHRQGSHLLQWIGPKKGEPCPS